MARTIKGTVISYLLGLIILVDGCCTKRDCPGFERTNTVTFSGFPCADVDSIAVEVFAASSAFGNRLDSTFSTAVSNDMNDPNVDVWIPDGLSASNDYRFTLRSAGTGQVFQLTHFVLQQETCNSCFPYHPASDHFDQLNGYSINGAAQSGSSVVIQPL